MSTTAPTTDATVPVIFEAKVSEAFKDKAENAADVRRLLDNALERVKSITDAAGAGAVVEGSITIGKQKFKL